MINQDTQVLLVESKWLERAAYCLLRDEDSAKDVVQETYLAALESPPQKGPPSRSWLSRVATNVVRKNHRGATRRANRERAAQYIDDSIPKSSARLLSEKQAAARLGESVQRLDEPQRSAVLLRFVDDMTIAQVAAAQGVPVGTADSRIREGLRRLRVDLDEQADGDSRPWLMALCPTFGVSETQAATAAATGGISMTKIVLLIAALLSVGALIMTQRGASEAKSSEVSNLESDVSSTPLERKRPMLAAPDEIGTTTRATAMPAGQPSRDLSSKVPPSLDYEITKLGPEQVAVCLQGGPSALVLPSSLGFSPPPPPPTFSRIIRGRVMTQSGQPVHGAAILASRSPRQSFDSLTGTAGTMTDKAGDFELTVHTEKSLYVMALHRSFGWSEIVSAPDGTDTSVVELRIDSPAKVSGQVRYGEEPTASSVLLTSVLTTEDHALELSIKTDDNGIFEFGMLPAGEYVVAASPLYGWSGGSAQWAKRTLRVSAGETQVADLVITKATLVVGEVALPKNAPTPRAIEYWLFAGTHHLFTSKAVEALAKELGRGNCRGVLFGGVDALTAVQFHDVPEGPVTFCAEIKNRDESGWIQCKTMAIPPQESLVEIRFDPPR